MKRKKLLSTAVAGMLVAAQMVMPVMAADGGEVDVSVTTKTAVIRVTVPTSIVIAVDQFEMADPGTQINSGVFTMENNSGIHVKVTVTSTADLKATTKLLDTKTAATSATANEGEAWVAVAAQTSANSYDDGSATAIGELDETNANVTTFKQGTESNATKGTAVQTFYLKKTTAAYKLLNASQKADVTYAQYYKLTAETVADASALATLIAGKDIYVGSAAAANDQVLTFVPKGGTHTYASGEFYYSVEPGPTKKADIADDHTDLYVYADGTADADGKAAFRYIGKLSGKQETWSNTDITAVNIKYDIVGVTETRWTEVENDCTYGLYASDDSGSSTTTATACKLQTIASGTGTDITTSTTADKGIYIKVGTAFLTTTSDKLTSVKLNNTELTISTKGNSTANSNAVYFKLPAGTTLTANDVITIVLDGTTYTFTVA